jgi:Ni/Fe-hydrogenase subunit HybB-like protein
VGGKLLTPGFKALLVVAAIGVVALFIRFTQGLGAATGMNDAYAFGLWIALDVVMGTAVGCGGYAMALLVYIFNKGQYHPLVRPAMLTGALGYTFAGTSILIDVGRYWGIWKIPTYVTWWNFDSALLEVALCVMTYMMVLWIEFSPSLFERLKKSPNPSTQSLGATWSKRLDKAMPWIIALGLLLPTMHQSSLGTVMMLPISKMQPLWFSPFLPLLFLINCIFIGYAAVIAESTISATVFKRARETKVLGTMAPVMIGLVFAFTVVRFLDLIVRGKLGTAFVFDRFAFFFWLETALVLAGAFMLFSERTRTSTASLFRVALYLLFGGLLYRFDTYLIAYNPGAGWSYFPSVLELIISLGLISMEIMIYIFLVKKLPVLSGASAPATR